MDTDTSLDAWHATTIPVVRKNEQVAITFFDRLDAKLEQYSL